MLTCFVFPIGHFHDDDIIDYNYQTTNDVEFYFNRFVLNDITKTKDNNTPKLWNREHVDVPTTSCGDLLSQEIRLTTDHISKSDQKAS